MATMPKTPMTNTGSTEAPYHKYHAETYVLSGHIKSPIDREIHRQALIEIDDDRGGDFFERVERFRVDDVLSFDAGFAEVSGSRDPNTNAWVTLVKAGLERFNVSDVVTMDGVVARASTNHPVENGHVPVVSFEGTKFGNLRINGTPVQVELDLAICGSRPENDQLYTGDLSFLDRVEEQVAAIAHSFGLPSEVKAEYDRELSYIKQLKQRIRNGGSVEVGQQLPRVKCSLVKSIAPIPGVKVFGNILEIPDLGLVSLGDLEVGEKLYQTEYRPSNYFAVTMVRVKLHHKKHGKSHGPYTMMNGVHHP